MQTSWIESANDGITDFPIQNLPFGVFSTNSLDPRIGVAIGNYVLDLRACSETGNPRSCKFCDPAGMLCFRAQSPHVFREQSLVRITHATHRDPPHRYTDRNSR